MKRTASNIHGSFYVDSHCIDCDLCLHIAPDNFARDDVEGYCYIKKQPQTEEERQLCREALVSCPTEAIGDDGA